MIRAGMGLPKRPAPAESSLDLVERARSGDADALNALCERYLPRLQRWAHGRLPAWARGALDTQDVVQDTLMNVARHIGSFVPRHEAAFQAFVRQALLNRIRDEIRRVQRRPGLDPLGSGQWHQANEPSPLEQAIGMEALDRYDAALERLRSEDREAIVLSVEFGLSHAAIAESLGKPSAEAARMAVTRALVKLAKKMAVSSAPA